MPLPLFFIGAAVATGAIGGAKNIKAVADNAKAGQINNQANMSIELAKSSLEHQRSAVGTALDKLGALKLDVLDHDVMNFVSLFEQIKNILEYRLSDTVQCRQDNLIAPTKRSPHRERFWKDYQSKGIDYVIKKYGNAGLKHNIKNMLGGVKRRIKKIFNK